MRANDQPFDACAVEERYLAVKERIWRAAERCGRDPASVKLVAVTKNFGEEAILPLIGQGHLCFGENRVQEALRKWPSFRERYPLLELHLIGQLQTNKAREAIANFECIETLDRPKLAAALAAEIEKQGKSPKLLIQVNIGLEAQKGGIAPSDAADFLSRCEGEFGLSVSGLMCIPPADENPVPNFEAMAALRHRLSLPELSMGMSGDYEEAIKAGATIIRVGSAIFGSR